MSQRAAGEPSSFALDVYFADGRRGDASLAAHVDSCARCTAYLAELAAQAAPAVASPAPAALRSVDFSARARRAVGPVGRAAALTSAAACASLLVWHSLGETDQPAYVGSKGVPALQVVIRDAAGARVWDGKAALRAGDSVALRADCDRFTHLTVAVAQAGGVARVFDAACPHQNDVLPFSLIADAKPGVERIDVVFSRTSLDATALEAALRRLERGDDVWVHRVLLQKEAARP